MPHLWSSVRVNKRRLIKDGFHQVWCHKFTIKLLSSFLNIGIIIITQTTLMKDFCQSPALLAASVPAHEEAGLLAGLAGQAAVEGGLGTGDNIMITSDTNNI